LDIKTESINLGHSMAYLVGSVVYNIK